MDKNSLSHYGKLVAVIIVLAILISLATPFASVIKRGVSNSVLDFKDNGINALDAIDTNVAYFDGSIPKPSLALQGSNLVITTSVSEVVKYKIYSGSTVVGEVTATYPSTSFNLSNVALNSEYVSVVAYTNDKKSNAQKLRIGVALVADATEHGTMTIDGQEGLTEYLEYVLIGYDSVTLKAVPESGYKVAYWKRTTKSSGESTYIDRVATINAPPLGISVSYQPVFVPEGESVKLYLDNTKMIIGVGDVAPAIPDRTGYTADTWVSSSVSNGVETFYPNYTRTSDTTTLTINYSDGSVETRELIYDGQVSLTAKSDMAKWMITIDGKTSVLSYKESYVFRFDMFSEATITETITSVADGVVISGVQAYYDKSGSRARFVVAQEVPEGATLVERGVLLSDDGSIASSMKVDTDGVIVGRVTASPVDASPTFIINKTKVYAGDTYYGRPYIIYTLNGETITEYGTTMSVTGA